MYVCMPIEISGYRHLIVYLSVYAFNRLTEQVAREGGCPACEPEMIPSQTVKQTGALCNPGSRRRGPAELPRLTSLRYFIEAIQVMLLGVGFGVR